jgi:hypothetical protein
MTRRGFNLVLVQNMGAEARSLHHPHQAISRTFVSEKEFTWLHGYHGYDSARDFKLSAYCCISLQPLLSYAKGSLFQVTGYHVVNTNTTVNRLTR